MKKLEEGVTTLTVSNFISLESSNAGNDWLYLSIDWLATAASWHIWQSDALKKYSRALYLSSELSNATAATWK